MKRSNLNFLIDALAFAALLLLVSTGMVLEYQLPAGSGGRAATGLGPGSWDRPVEMLWGWTRHQWGELHFWTAWALMAVLAVHLALHWKWIVCVVKGKPSDASGGRLALGALGLAAVVVLTAIPLVSRTQSTSRRDLLRNSGAVLEDAAPPDAHGGPDASESLSTTWLRGSLTLEQVAQSSGKPTAWLIDKLELPAHTRPSDRIGQLLRDNGLRMRDLRALLASPSGPGT